MKKKYSAVSAFVCALLVAGTSVANFPVNAVTDNSYDAEFNVDFSGEKKAISPYIYGVNEHANLKKVSPTAIRQGGNRFTAYNWETNYSNAGSDWENSSDTYLSTSTTPGACAIELSEDSQTYGVDYKFTTLQMLGYVSADKDGSVSEAEKAPSARWNEVKARKDGELSMTPDLTDGTVYMDEYVNYLVNTLGDSTTATGMQGYSLDNEPALWSHTHSLIHENPVSMTELVDKSVELASVVKDIDKNAEVFGPALWGYLACKQLADSETDNEWETIKEQGGYDWFIEYYLDEMKKASDEYGSRLIDCMDFHYYAQAAQINGTQEDILQGVRTLYEEGFQENSWIGDMIQWAPSDFPLLPRVQEAIDEYYPGTKLAITEYDFYGSNQIEGAVVEAEALGCFADNNVYLATYWGDGNSPYTFSAINLYTNYDGKGSSFGDTLLETSIEDTSLSNAYASVDSDDDSQVNIVITNKNTEKAENATVNLKNTDNEYKSAVVYGIVEGSSDIIVLDKITDIKDNSFTVELPSVSVVHAVVSEDANAFDDIEVYDPSAEPEIKSVVFSGDTLEQGEAGYFIEVENPEKISKIKLETELTPADASTWYSLGGGLCLTIDTDTEKGTWAFKDFMVSNSATDVEVEFDGTFSVPVGETNEEQNGVLTGTKIEIQPWWSASELEGNVEMTLKSVTVFYEAEEGEVTETTETTETTEAVESETSESETTTAETEISTSETTSEVQTGTSSSFGEATLLGDVNNDGIVDIRDVTTLNQSLIKAVTLDETQTANADVIKDGAIDVSDLGQLKKFIIKLIEKL